MLENTEVRDRDQVISRYYSKAWKRNHNFPEDDEESKFASPDSVAPMFSFSLDTPADENVELENEMGRSPHSSSIFLPSPQRQGTARSRGITLVNTNTERNANANEEQHVLMVDQLWMWILDESKSSSPYGRNGG
jgi:hypothetical protein